VRIVKLLYFLMFAVAIVLAAPASATAGTPGCQRPVAGSEVTAPPDLFSNDGVLNVTFNYYTSLDSESRTLFCFVTPDGQESPTLHVLPGDTLNIILHNMLPVVAGAASAEMAVAPDIWGCGWTDMNSSSVNMHFHGTNTRPICHNDQVIHTLVDAGDTYAYHVNFPFDEPPGLYWYHPHVHGISDFALQGGATGAIEVEGIERIQHKVAGLPERVLLVRDQRVDLISSKRTGVLPRDANTPTTPPLPSWDVSLNYVPISFPTEVPAVMKVMPGRKEFWRLANTSSDTIIDVDLIYDGVAQPLEIAALDAVPTGSHDGTSLGQTFTVTHILLPPAGRAEFIVTTPSATVKKAIFETRAIDTGPAGDTDTQRTLAVLVPDIAIAPVALRTIPQASGKAGPQRFDGLSAAPVVAQRNLYFSESQPAPNAPWGGMQSFFITVDGQKPVVFEPTNPPAIITHQGAVEHWTIENRAQEVHEFHIHQIHFLLLAINNVPLPPGQQQFYDTFQIPYWKGTGPYPSITVAMDFRGDIAGDFVYHCHILDHEDNGMMAIIRVLPPPPVTR